PSRVLFSRVSNKRRAAMLERELVKKIDTMTELLHKAAQPASQAGQIFKANGGPVGTQWNGNDDVPWNRNNRLMAQLAKSYNHETVSRYLAKGRSRKPRGI